MPRLGDKGHEVKEIQGLLGLSIDGVFGPNTEKEVNKFQQENGLTPDGIVGPRTMELFHPTTDLQESAAWIEPYLLL